MKLRFEDRNTGGQFTLVMQEECLTGCGIRGEQHTTNTLVCNTREAQTVTIDQIPYILPADSILPLMANQHFVFEKPEALVAWQFNREFYCIADHDAEVGCAGFLFYGICHPLFIRLTKEEVEDISLMEKLCVQDMKFCDRMQGEMLRTLLKRMIINITRIAKKQTENYERFREEKLDVVRMFNLLLEANFKTAHEVQFYAQALNKSPKTLANLFAIFHYPAPSKLIQRRIALEAKRYLQYTEMTAKEIAYSLGFVSPAHFSRFFKEQTGNNISFFRSRENNKN